MVVVRFLVGNFRLNDREAERHGKLWRDLYRHDRIVAACAERVLDLAPRAGASLKGEVYGIDASAAAVLSRDKLHGAVVRS